MYNLLLSFNIIVEKMAKYSGKLSFFCENICIYQTKIVILQPKSLL